MRYDVKARGRQLFLHVAAHCISHDDLSYLFCFHLAVSRLILPSPSLSPPFPPPCLFPCPVVLALYTFVLSVRRLAAHALFAFPGDVEPPLQFVMLASFDHTNPTLPVEERMAVALRRSGVSITCEYCHTYTI